MRICGNKVGVDAVKEKTMKKLILILMFTLVIGCILIGCAEKKAFDANACIEDMKALGLNVKESATDGEELRFANAKVNMEIGLFKGNFTVDLVSYTHLIKGDDEKNGCKIIEFATEEQANMYGGFFMNNRGEDDGWKVAIVDKTVIITNISEVENSINLIFK